MASAAIRSRSRPTRKLPLGHQVTGWWLLIPPCSTFTQEHEPQPLYLGSPSGQQKPAPTPGESMASVAIRSRSRPARYCPLGHQATAWWLLIPACSTPTHEHCPHGLNCATLSGQQNPAPIPGESMASVAIRSRSRPVRKLPFEHQVALWWLLIPACSTPTHEHWPQRATKGVAVGVGPAGFWVAVGCAGGGLVAVAAGCGGAVVGSGPGPPSTCSVTVRS
jgi:hypothetical protein